MMRSRHSVIGQQVAQAKAVRQVTFPAPTLGWVTVNSLTGSKPGSALRLENIFPQQQNARIRRGAAIHQSILVPPVSFAAYRAVGLKKLFVLSDDSIFDVTASGDTYLLDSDGEILLDSDGEPLIEFELSAMVTGLGSGYASYVNFTNDAGTFLILVNGTDPLQRYNGVAWTAVPVFEGTTDPEDVDTDIFSVVAAYRNRLFFVEKGTMNVWYLGVNAIEGDANKFPLSGIFDGGGSIMTIGTWSMDAGDGLDDKFVIITDQGQVAIFQGSDPSDANDWFLVGRYDISKPLGPRAMMRQGGDIIVGTEEGAIPISAAVTKDPAALSLAAASAPIEPDWAREAALRRDFNWEILKWTELNMVIVSLPTSSAEPEDHYCFVANTETGAWTKYTGWNIRCMEYFEGQVYFGSPDGRIYAAEQGGSDGGSPYFPVWIANWDDFGTPGRLKTVHQARATFLSQGDVNPRISFSTEYTVRLPGFPDPAPSLAAASLWDEAIFDVDVWDGGGLPKEMFSTRWLSQGKTGYAHALQLQTTQQSEFASDVEIVEVTATYEVGALVI